MSALDATFLGIEDDANQMHIGAIAELEGPPPAQDDVLAFVTSKLPLIARYRQRVVVAPFGIARPRWADDPTFRVERHVHRVRVPSPGGWNELCELVGQLMSQPLDRNQPLWELYVVEGLSEGHWTLVTKVHHCMADGIAGSDLLTVLLDTERSPRPPAADVWDPRPVPSLPGRARASLGDAIAMPAHALRTVASAARSPRRSARDLTSAIGLAWRLARPAERSSLTGPIGRNRRWTGVRVDLSDVKALRTTFGGTVNDVALALVTSGLRDLLLARGESLDGRCVRTLVPVSVRGPQARGLLGNRVAALIADLPIGVGDPVARLAWITHEMDGLKRNEEAHAAVVALTAGDLLPFPAAAAIAQLVTHRQRGVQTVTTNVPGPEMPLYLRGREVLAVHPYVPLAGTVRVGTAMLSYRSMLAFGVTGDGDGARDVEVVAAGIEQGLRELLESRT